MAVPPQIATETVAPARAAAPVARPGQVPVGSPLSRRLCFAAARFVTAEGERASVDWEASWELRRRLQDAGFPLAEGLDLDERERIGWDALRRALAERSARGFP